MAVILETSLGDITVDLYTEERPKCCTNFLKLCKVKYYNFCLFHSVQRNLVAQTGDPSSSGRGGESIYGMLYGEQARYFDLEVSPRIKHKKTGLISMVNNGSNMHGSQFFLTLGENLDYLDGLHTVFGEIAEGMDVLMKINEAYCDNSNRPYKDIRIYHTIIVDDPYDDPPGLQIPDRSPQLTAEQLESDRIGAEEDIDDFQGRSELEIKEIMEEREAKANAQILTMVGDLPEEDVAPEDNVLFVCKLNPVTTDDDLEIIFSRFGNIKSCEVIRDHKTKESLQYAFIEFEKPDQCENAYFKMDNVLIDDRRIHVDFSQSVAKVKWRGKGKGVDFPKGKESKDTWGDKYTIKDTSKKNDSYQLVFEGSDDDSSTQKMKKKHKKKKSGSDTDRGRKDKKKNRNSSSPEQPEARYKYEKGYRKDYKEKQIEKDRKRTTVTKYEQDTYDSIDKKTFKKHRHDKDKDNRQEKNKYSEESEDSDGNYRRKSGHRDGSEEKNRKRGKYPERDSSNEKYRKKPKYAERDSSEEKYRKKDKYSKRDSSEEKYRKKDKYRDSSEEKFKQKDRHKRNREENYKRKDKNRDSREEKYRKKDKYRDSSSEDEFKQKDGYKRNREENYRKKDKNRDSSEEKIIRNKERNRHR